MQLRRVQVQHHRDAQPAAGPDHHALAHQAQALGHVHVHAGDAPLHPAAGQPAQAEALAARLSASLPEAIGRSITVRAVGDREAAGEYLSGYLIERSLVPGQTMHVTLVRTKGHGVEEKMKVDLVVKELSFERAAGIGKQPDGGATNGDG